MAPNNFIPPLSQRIALFCSTDFRTPMKLALVNNAFREVIVDYSTALLCWNNLVRVSDATTSSKVKNRDKLVFAFDKLSAQTVFDGSVADDRSYDTLLQWVLPQLLEVQGKFRPKEAPSAEHLSAILFNILKKPAEEVREKGQKEFDDDDDEIPMKISIFDTAYPTQFICRFCKTYSPVELLVHAAEYYRPSVQTQLVDLVTEANRRREQNVERNSVVLLADMLIHDLCFHSSLDEREAETKLRPGFVFVPWNVCRFIHAYKSQFVLNFLDTFYRISQSTQNPGIFESLLVPIKNKYLVGDNGANVTLAMRLCGKGKVKVLESLLAKMTPEVFKQQLLFRKQNGNRDNLFDCAFYHPGVCYFLVKLLLEKAKSCDAIPLLFSARGTPSSSSSSDESGHSEYLDKAIRRFLFSCRKFQSPQELSSPTPKQIKAHKRENERHAKMLILLLKYLSDFNLLTDEDLSKERVVPPLNWRLSLIHWCMSCNRPMTLAAVLSFFSSEAALSKFLSTPSPHADEFEWDAGMDELRKMTNLYEMCLEARKSFCDCVV